MAIYTLCFFELIHKNPLSGALDFTSGAVASVVPDARTCVGVCFVASRRLAEIPLGKTNRIETINNGE